MHRGAIGLVVPGLVAAAVAVTAPAALAAGGPAAGASGTQHAVFVQTNDLSGNTVVAYRRAADGSLTRERTYPTGGKGGLADQAPLDSLASQGSLTYDAGHGLLYAVNAGSDSVTVFGVSGDRLQRRQVVSSRGEFPVSVAVIDDLVAVLDAGGQGAVAVYRVAGGRLVPVVGGWRSLGLANTDPPLFISAPAQVGFDPAGRHVLVTTKNHNTIDVWSVGTAGRLGTRVANVSAGAVPFGFVFDRFGHLAVTEAGASTVTTYRLRPDGHLSVLTASVPDGAAALCWAVTARGLVVGANAGSATLSSYRTGPDGGLVLVQAVATTTGAGPIDMTTTAGGRLLYLIDAVAGELQGFRVHLDGTLSLVTTEGGLPVFDAGGMEGVAAT